MKTNDGVSKTRLVFLTSIIIFIIYGFIAYFYYFTYESINVKLIDNASIEYGTKNYNIKKLIKNVNGKILSVKKDVNLDTVGPQEVILVVEKNKITKEVPVVIPVVDKDAPVINLKSDKITITSGEAVDLNNNIDSVVDEVDGNIQLKSDDNSKLNLYDISYDDDISSVGTHDIKVQAVDKSGNIANIMFTLEVVKPSPYVAAMQVHRGLSANPAANQLVSTAYSLLGSPYVGGGNSPAGFDCSGFVQYVYASAGYSVSRSSSTQLYDGYGVNFEDMQPGDIISWGYGDGVASHSSMYVGDGMMIHAANPSTGVILSNVNWWINGSGSRILSVRRII